MHTAIRGPYGDMLIIAYVKPVYGKEKQHPNTNAILQFCHSDRELSTTLAEMMHAEHYTRTRGLPAVLCAQKL